MVLAQISPSLPWLVFAALVLSALVVAQRAMSKSGADKAGEPSGRSDEADSNRFLGKRFASLEVHLHDFAREAEARIETRIAQLDRLIEAADRDILRLTTLLGANRERTTARAPDVIQESLPEPSTTPQPASAARASNPIGGLSAAQKEMACHLYQAGFSIPEIAHMVGRSPEEVQSILRAA